MPVMLKDGKVLLVDGKVATDPACCCIPTATLLCDSIAVSWAKCGWREFGTVASPPKFYTLQTYDHHRTASKSCYAATPASSCQDGYDITTNIVRAFRYVVWELDDGHYDPDNPGAKHCALSVDSQSGTFAGTSCSGGSYSEETIEEIGDFAPNSYTVVSPTLKTYSSPGSVVRPECTPSTISFTNESSYTLSDEYTTAMMISDAIAQLPAFNGVFNEEADGCFASRNLAGDQSSYTIQRLQYKIALAAAAVVDVVVRWNETLTPESGSPSVTGFVETIAAGDLETSVHTRNEPGSDGTYTITDITVALS